MSRMFYPKLAANNIKKNYKTYVPFIMTCTLSVMMFYIMFFLRNNKGLDIMGGGQTLRSILGMGLVVIGIFSVIFLFYTNSFLIKRRKKEFGLFNILGMDKKNLAKVIAAETFYAAAISISLGLILGIVFSKLGTLILFRLLDFELPFGFDISWSAAGYTVLVFSVIFFLMVLNNLRHIHLSKPVELLAAGNVGEKEPGTKWLLAFAGTVCLAAGYVIAIVTQEPLQALALFLVAVVLVIAGTYLVFVAGSIAFLKLLRKNKGFYYQTKHFISVSGMIYRMKQNAVGLANICVLSTMVIVMLSTTFSLYLGLNDELRSQYPRNLFVRGCDIDVQKSRAAADEAKDLAEKMDIKQKHTVDYRYLAFHASYKKSRFKNAYPGDAYQSGDNGMVILIPLDEYNRMQDTEVRLSKGEAVFYSPNAQLHEKEVYFRDQKVKIIKTVKNINVQESYYMRLADVYYFIVPGEEDVIQIAKKFPTSGKQNDLDFYYGFDTDASPKKQINYVGELNSLYTEKYTEGGERDLLAEGSENVRAGFLSVYRGLFFVGLFLGAIFIMAVVLIMYYKQISEGYEDKERFRIMKNVGMSHREIKKTIRSQVLTVFFLPLAVAGIHIAFAFKMIVRMLAVMNMTNEILFACCVTATVAVFAVFYSVVYAMTAKVYYRIVE